MDLNDTAQKVNGPTVHLSHLDIISSEFGLSSAMVYVARHVFMKISVRKLVTHSYLHDYYQNN